MQWTNNDAEKLYLEAQKKAMVDEEFRKELLEDANSALEKLSGQKLPEGMRLKVIENDPNYTATFVLPDMLSEEIDTKDLDKAAGGISTLLVLSACGAAIKIGPCPADACGAQK